MMSETTQDLIAAMVAGNAIDTENAFSAAMAEKLSGKLDALRQNVAQNMFKTPEDEEVSSEYEDEIEASVEEQQMEETPAEEETEQ